MSMRRRAVPKIVRLSLSRHVETFFDILVPPGVSQEEAHIYLEAHLGKQIAEHVERGELDDAGSSEQIRSGPSSTTDS